MPPGTAFSYHDRYCFDLRAFRYGCRTDTPFGCLFLWHRRLISGTVPLSREWFGFCLSCGFPLSLCAMPPRSGTKLTDPDSGGANSKHHMIQAAVLFPFGSVQQAVVFRFRSNPDCRPQIPCAGFSKPHLAGRQSPGSPDRNEWRTAGIYSAGMVALLQLLPIFQNLCFC